VVQQPALGLLVLLQGSEGPWLPGCVPWSDLQQHAVDTYTHTHTHTVTHVWALLQYVHTSKVYEI
jgi:hypothetical protein